MRTFSSHGFSRLATILTVVVVIGVCVGSIVPFASAVAPDNVVSYQGRILNANAVPVSDASLDMQFRLYDSLAAGNCLWSNDDSACLTDADMAVTLEEGLFSVNLGDTGDSFAAIPDSVFADDATVYLEIEIEGEVLTPRKRVVAAPYALNSQTLDGLDSSELCQTDGTGCPPRYWESSAFGTYEDDDDVIVGTSGNETIANPLFSLNGDDFFVAGAAGVEGGVYTDTGFSVGTTLAILEGSITRTTGTLTIEADDLAINTDSGDITITPTDDLFVTLASTSRFQVSNTADGTGDLTLFTASLADDADATDDLFGLAIAIDNESGDAGDTLRGLGIRLEDSTANATLDFFADFNNVDTAAVVDTGLSIRSSGGGAITTAISVTDSDIVTALAFGANDIDGTNFDVTGGTGNITTAGDIAVNGDDITSDGTLTINSSGTIQLGTDDDLLPQLGAGDADLGSSGVAWDNVFVRNTDDATNVSLSSDGSGETNSGASVIGVFDEFANSSSGNVQDVLDDLDAVISGFGGLTLDNVYDNDPDKILAVDTDDLEFSLNASGLDFIVDMQSTGIFVIQEAGTASTTFQTDGDVLFAGGNVFLGSDTVSGVNASFTANGDDIFTTGDIAAQDSMYADTFVAGDSSTIYSNGSFTDNDSNADDLFDVILAAAADSLRVSTGNLRVGNGSPDVALGGEDVYFEGTFEVDGSSLMNGTLTVDDTAVGLSDASAVTISGTIADDGDATDDVTGLRINATNNSGDAGDTLVGIEINYLDAAANQTLDAFADFDNEDTAATIATGLAIRSSGGGAITTAISLTDSDIVTALAFGANDIDGTNFDVSGATGDVTVSPGAGIDTNAAGALSIGNTNATSTNICSSAACDTLNIGAFADADTINIGTTGGSDVISIGQGTADIALTDAQWSITGAGNITTLGDIAVNGDDITSDGTLSITPGGASNLVNILTGNLQVGNGVPGVTLNGEDAYIEGTFEVDGSSQFDGAVTFNGALTYNTDVDFAFGDGENFTITSTSNSDLAIQSMSVTQADDADATDDLIGLDISLANSSGDAGDTVTGLRIQNTNTASNQVTDALISLDNLETSAAVTAGIVINATGTVTSGLDVSAANIGSAILFGTNDLSGTNFGVTGASGNVVTNGDIAVNGDDITSDGTLNITPGGASNQVNILTGNLQVGNGTPGVTLNGEDAYIEGTLEVDGSVQIDNTLTATDFVCTDCLDFTEFSDTLGLDAATSITGTAGEVFTISRTLTDATSEVGMRLAVTALDTTAGTIAQYGLEIQNAISSEGLDSLLRIHNVDTDDSVATGLQIDSNAGTILTAIDISSANIVTDIEFQNDATLSNDTNGDVVLSENTRSFTWDFDEVASRIKLESASELEFESTSNTAGAVTINSTTGGIDILASGAAAGEDIDITATGSSVHITSTEAVLDAIELDASGGGVGSIQLTSSASGGVSFDVGTNGFVGNIVGDAGFAFGAIADDVTTGDAFGIQAHGITSGTVGNFASSGIDRTSGDIINVTASGTDTSAGTMSGNEIQVQRSMVNNSGGVLNLTGDLLNIRNNPSNTSGTLNDSADLLFLDQDFTTSTGSIINIDSESTTSVAINIDSEATTANVATFDGSVLTTGDILSLVGGNFTDDSGLALTIDVTESTETADIMNIQTNFSSGNNNVFRIEADGEAFSDVGFTAGAFSTNYYDGSITHTSGDFTFTPGGAGDDLIIATGNLKVGDGAPGVALGGEDMYVEGTFEVDGTAQFDGAVTLNGAMTYNTDVDFTFNSAGSNTENFTITHTHASDVSVSPITLNYTNSAAADTGLAYLMDLINQNDGGATGTPDGFMLLRQLDSNETVADGIAFAVSSPGVLTDAFDGTDTAIVNAIHTGDNFLLFNTIREAELSAGTLTWEDSSGNDLMTLLDNGTNGNLTVTNDLTTTGDVIVNGNDITSTGAITVTPGGTGDFIVSVDDQTNMQITATAAQSGALLALSNSGFGTAAGDGLNITYDTASDASTDALEALVISVTGSGDALDAISGVRLANLTGTAASEFALRVGTGWDTDIRLEDTTAEIAFGNGGTLSLTDTIGNVLAGWTDNGTNADFTLTGDATIQGDNIDSAGAPLVLNATAADEVRVGTGAPTSASGAGDLYVTGIIESDSGGQFGDTSGSDQFIFTSDATTTIPFLFNPTNVTTASAMDITRDNQAGTDFTNTTTGLVAIAQNDTASSGDVLYVSNSGDDGMLLDLDDNVTGSNHNAIQLLFADNNLASGGAGGTGAGAIRILAEDNALTMTGDTSSRRAAIFRLETNSESTDTFNFLAMNSDVDATVAQDAEWRVDSTGATFADNAYTSGGADYAEYFRTDDTTLAAGELVSINVGKQETIRRSSGKGDQTLFGVISARAGFIGNNAAGLSVEELAVVDPKAKLVAMIGQVPINVNTENGPIKIGDHITSSSTPGIGMKANAGDVTVGMAMEAYSGSGVGQVTVLISPNVPRPIVQNTASQMPSSNLNSLSMGGNIYLNGNDILGVRRIAGIADRWSVEEDGTFKTEGLIKTVVTSYQNEKVETAAVTSTDVMITMVGTGEIENGMATIAFEDLNPSFNDITSTTAPVRVVVTANGPVSLYVAEKTNNGFSVREIGGATSGVTFDWMVTAYRKDFEPEPVVAGAEDSVEEPLVEETIPPEETPVEEVVEEPVVQEESVPEETQPTPSEEPVIEEPTVGSEPVEEPISEEPIEETPSEPTEPVDPALAESPSPSDSTSSDEGGTSPDAESPSEGV